MIVDPRKVLLSLLALLVFAGVISSTPALTFMSLAVGLALVTGGVWASSGAEHFDCRHHVSEDRCMTGDTLQLTVELDNPTFLPLPWVEMTDFTPGRAFFAGRDTDPDSAVAGDLFIRTGMSWFQRLRRTYHVTLTARGYYQVGPSVVRVWDPLGLTHTEKRIENRQALMVYPITVSLAELGISSDHPFGDPERQHWLFRDPFSVAGARPYEPGDAMRMIHWPATAAAGELMTRQQEGTRSPDVLIFVNLRTMTTAWHGTVSDFLELSMTAAGSVARYATGRGYRVGLYGNGSMLKEHEEASAPPLRIDPSSHPRQLRRILSALARSAPHGSHPLEKTLHRQAMKGLYGSTVIVISAILTDGLRSQFLRMAADGYSVTFIYTGDPPTPSVPGIRCHDLGGKRRWQEIAERWGHSAD